MTLQVRLEGIRARRAGGLAAAGVVAMALVGCVVEDDPPTSTAESAVISCPTTPTQINHSLVVTEPETLKRFSFGAVMDAILDSVKHAPMTRLQLFQNWMQTYAPLACPGTDIDPNGYGLRCPRTREASLAASDPYNKLSPDFFKPVALFNRFDLAPKDGRHCGEHRIVFAKASASALDRGFLIFEAALPNPQPAQGLAGCFPVARFWQSLSGASADKRAEALEAFYFTGIVEPTTGVTIGPVITAANYGLIARRGEIRLFGYGDAERAGQVRTNMFIDASGLFEWNLREFKLDLDCTHSPATEFDADADTVVRPLPTACNLRFEHVTVANNPANELFDDSHVNAPDFQSHFVKHDVASLASPPPGLVCGGPANLIGMGTPDDFNEFESLSSGSTDVVYSGFTSAPFRAAITTKVGVVNPALDATNVLDRATTQTCGGCHQHSNNDPLGGGIAWPASLGFVHVDETSALSTALTGTFLPFRQCVLDDYIADVCGGYSIGGDGGLTLGGKADGAAN
ncbi:MAG TPA: hypothetical protein VFD53_02835 [Ilumatobacter sp.]|jgi:hypothetical protein|nr:hypothetical protein [Ilumatobacter sp.]